MPNRKFPAKTKPPASPPQYRVSIKLGTEIYRAKAPTIAEAIRALTAEGITKAKAVITVEVGSRIKKTYRKAEVFLYPVQTRKLFINTVAQELFQKRMIGALK